MNQSRLVTARVYANELVENLTELLVLQRNGLDGARAQNAEADALYSIKRIAKEMGLSEELAASARRPSMGTLMSAIGDVRAEAEAALSQPEQVA